MHKEKIERSEAILRKKRNTRKGLQIRNKILVFLNENSSKKFRTDEIVDKTGSTYERISYHLKNMLAENVLIRTKIAYRNYWQISGLGQQTIKKWLEENNRLEE